MQNSLYQPLYIKTNTLIRSILWSVLSNTIFSKF